MNKTQQAFKNAQVFYINEKDQRCIAEAVAVTDGKFSFVGSEADLKAHISDETEIIDLHGHTMLPGLADSHLHVGRTAELIYDVRMGEEMIPPSTSRDDAIDGYIARLKEALTEDTAILRGAGWDSAFFMSFPEGHPTAADLDKVSTEIPIIAHSYDMHYMWVNSRAMELAGIDRNTPEPRNGVVMKDEDGNPTGIFQETTAMDLLLNNLPGADYTVEEYKQAVRYYQDNFAKNNGITLVFDALSTPNAIKAYGEMARDGELKMRIAGCIYADPSCPESQFDDMIRNKGIYDVGDDFKISTIKFFMDGSGFSFSMNEPFEEEILKAAGFPEDYRGYAQWEQDEINEIFKKLTESGLQIHVHCMGDGAVKETVNGFAYAAADRDIRENRHTIAHIMLSDEEDIERMAQLGIIAAVQPMWAEFDSFAQYQAVPLLGKERMDRHYPFGRLKKAGCIITSGTDFPVSPVENPMFGMQTGMVRHVGRFHPEYETYKDVCLGDEKNKLSLDDMVGSYTIWPAYQCFMENVTGSIEVGKSADFVILDGVITETAADQMENMKVMATYFKGKKIYSQEV